MDGPDVRATTAPVRGLTVDSDTSYLTITTPPSAEGTADNPQVRQTFSRVISIRALVLTWLPAEPTSVPAQTEASTTPEETATQEKPISVTLKVLVKQPGDQTFKELSEVSTITSKVRRQCTSLKFLLGSDHTWRLPFFLVTWIGQAWCFQILLYLSAGYNLQSWKSSTSNPIFANRWKNIGRRYRSTHWVPKYQWRSGDKIPFGCLGLR